MAIDKDKTDPKAGNTVQTYLETLGIQTPWEDNGLLDIEKIALIENHILQCMQILGLDMEDDSLVDTPSRVAKMWVKEKFYGLKPENFPKCTTVENKMKYNTMIVEKNVKVMSDCEHHLVTIDGVAHVAYIPNEKVLGLSKINRIVDYFARRPQIQERLTQQIGETLKFILGTDDVAVVVDAKHYCVASRGIEDVNSRTSTAFMSGSFLKQETRTEFYNIIGK